MHLNVMCIVSLKRRCYNLLLLKFKEALSYAIPSSFMNTFDRNAR